MKKLAMTVVVLLAVQSAWAGKYVCYRYLGGKPTGGFVKVDADSREEAEKKSLEKYRKLGYSLDYTKCKMDW
jgi:hypothetical protein